MTTIYYIIIFVLATIVLVGGLFAAFEIGKEEGICLYEHKNEEKKDEISKND